MSEVVPKVGAKFMMLSLLLFLLGLLVVFVLSSSFFGDAFSSYIPVYLYLVAWVACALGFWFTLPSADVTRSLQMLLALVLIISVVFPAWTLHHYPRERLIYAAATYNHRIILRLLLLMHPAQDEVNEALVLAASGGFAEVVSDMLAKGGDPNSRLLGNPTALMEAAWHGSPQTVALLLNRGARINDKNADEETALMWAAKTNHLEVTKILIAAGADLDAQNKRHESALSMSSNSSFTDISAALRAAGARDLSLNNTLLSPGAAH